MKPWAARINAVTIVVASFLVWARAQESYACPALQQRSLSACDRCVHDDLCGKGANDTFLKCDNWVKKCVHPDWTAQQIVDNCPEVDKDPLTWGAKCKLECPNQVSPFECAVHCLNEDFPCKWVPGCGIPRGLMRASFACMRSCIDHEDRLKSLYSVDKCSTAINKFGCKGSWHAISDYCPVSCNSAECPWRCGRDEEPNIYGRQCWQRVEQDGLDCYTAMREGQDCHCKCAQQYLYFSGRRTRAGGGAFQISDQIDGVTMARQILATAGDTLTIDFTGEGMRSEDPGHFQGPRLKIVEAGSNCGTGVLPAELTGLSCQAPDGADLLAGVICTTAPFTATGYLHRWRGIVINACGKYTLCHCNEKCDILSNWDRAGTLELKPTVNWGEMSAPLPGCEAYLPTLAPKNEKAPANETLEDAVVTYYLSLSGGLLAVPKVLDAVQKALAIFLRFESGLLKQEGGAPQQLPEPDDVTVSEFGAIFRRLRASHRGRRAQPSSDQCIDDDEAFREEAAKAGMMVQSCGEAFDLLKSIELLCSDKQLEQAVLNGCKKTCQFCSDDATTTAEPTPNASVSDEDSIVWPGGSDTLKLVIKVRTKTDASRRSVMGRYNDLDVDPQPFLQLLYAELESSGADIPGQLWAYKASGPFLEVFEPPPTTTPPPPTWRASTSIIAIVAGTGGGIVLLSCIVTYVIMRWQRGKYDVEEGQAGKTVTEVSEGGYRRKQKVVEASGPTVRPPEPSCWERIPCCRCLCPKREIRRIEPVNQSVMEGQLSLGCRVRLIGLSTAHFNGLEGFVTGGPNEKGRYTVDIIVDDDEQVREMQTLSFKPENLRPLPPESAVGGEAKKPQLPQNVTNTRTHAGSYRG